VFPLLTRGNFLFADSRLRFIIIIQDLTVNSAAKRG
jgi:hypothetical protein